MLRTDTAQPARLEAAALHQKTISGLRQAIRYMRAAAERRRQRLALSELDERLLRDIGLTRDDVALECAKPVWRR